MDSQGAPPCCDGHGLPPVQAMNAARVLPYEAGNPSGFPPPPTRPTGSRDHRCFTVPRAAPFAGGEVGASVVLEDPAPEGRSDAGRMVTSSVRADPRP